MSKYCGQILTLHTSWDSCERRRDQRKRRAMLLTFLYLHTEKTCPQCSVHTFNSSPLLPSIRFQTSHTVICVYTRTHAQSKFSHLLLNIFPFLKRIKCVSMNQKYPPNLMCWKFNPQIHILMVFGGGSLGSNHN
jgi:hypothetical protein